MQLELNSVEAYMDGTLELLLESYAEPHSFSLQIPLSIFSDQKLGILESLVRYMKNSLGMRYSHIGKLLKRDNRTIWTSYRSALIKSPSSDQSQNDSILIPISVFCDREKGPLQSLILYLKQNNYSFSDISRLLCRSYKTIWVSYNNTLKKRSRNGN